MPTTNDLYHFLTQGLGKIDGVRDWTANVELLTIKRGFLRLRGRATVNPT